MSYGQKKSLIFLYSLSHTHTNYLFQKRQHFTLFFLFSSRHTTLFWLSSFSLSGFILATHFSFYFLCGFLFLCFCTYSLCVFLKAVVPCSLFPLAFLPSENPFSLSWFHALFSISHREDPWAKAIKFFVTLFIYKILLLFSLGLGIHYLFNKESISSWTRNTLSL